MRVLLAAALAIIVPAAAALAQGLGATLSMQAPCQAADMVGAMLKREGYARVARGRDVEGDPFALYRRGDGQWRAIVFMPASDGTVLACALIGGDGLAVGDVGDGA